MRKGRGTVKRRKVGENVNKGSIQKRYLRIFKGASLEQAVQKVDSFSKKQPVQILNYEIVTKLSNGYTEFLVFYSSLEDE